MPLYHIIILSIVQGITEFLPISSSGHLVFAHNILCHTGENGNFDTLNLDIAVHVGTLLAVLAYFYKDVAQMMMALINFRNPERQNDLKLIGYIILSSLPLIVSGYFLYLYQPFWLRSLHILALSSIFFGILLYFADKFRPESKDLRKMNTKNAILIGISQVFALIPGTSRSGVTMTAARALGFTRTDSARFSLFLSMVAISGAGTLAGLDILQSTDTQFTFDIIIAVFLSFITAFLAITLMMKWLTHFSFTPFVIYRIILGLALLAWIYTGQTNFCF